MLAAHCLLLSVAVTCLDSVNGFRTCKPYLLIPLFPAKLLCETEIGRGRWLVGHNFSIWDSPVRRMRFFEFPQFTLWRPWHLEAKLDNLAGFLSRLSVSPYIKCGCHCRLCIFLSTMRMQCKQWNQVFEQQFVVSKHSAVDRSAVCLQVHYLLPICYTHCHASGCYGRNCRGCAKSWQDFFIHVVLRSIYRICSFQLFYCLLFYSAITSASIFGNTYQRSNVPLNINEYLWNSF